MSALFFDIDGTLIDKSMILREKTVSALRRVKENGHYIFINTGRARSALPKEIESIQFDGLICGCGTYIEINGDVHLLRQIDGERSKRVISLLQEANAGFILEGKNNCYFDKRKSRFSGIERTKKYFGELDIGEYIDEKRNIAFEKVFVYTDDKSDLKKIFLLKNENMTVIDRGNSQFEIIQRQYNKGTGCEFVRNKLNLKKEDIYVFGDSSNDLDMFLVAGNAIAMKGSSSDILRASTYVTDSVEDYGVEKAIKHLGL